MILIILAFLIQLVLYLITALIGLIISIVGIPLWLLIGLIIVIVDITNGAPATTHDLIQGIINLVQSIITAISQIHFG